MIRACALRERGITTWPKADDAARERMRTPRLSFIFRPLLLLSDEDGAHGRGNLKQRSAAVHGAFRDDQPALPTHADAGKLNGDATGGVGQIVLGTYVHTYIRRNENGDVTVSGGQKGLRKKLAGEEAGHDVAERRGDVHGAGDVADVDAAAGAFTLNS